MCILQVEVSDILKAVLQRMTSRGSDCSCLFVLCLTMKILHVLTHLPLMLFVGDIFHAAPNIDHSQDFVRRDIKGWLNWLRNEIGFDGWRLDFVR